SGDCGWSGASGSSAALAAACDGCEAGVDALCVDVGRVERPAVPGGHGLARCTVRWKPAVGFGSPG
ncbi:hypothetical protein, partial [Falsiroseomonas sp. E2-1-a20]|uniref:hypothetical protein n=1 Tax=Falsiroseomonas sp. E2-1-a20 TaxID=3239300 RepID=UPI003F3D6DC4